MIRFVFLGSILLLSACAAPSQWNVMRGPSSKQGLLYLNLSCDNDNRLVFYKTNDLDDKSYLGGWVSQQNLGHGSVGCNKELDKVRLMPMDAGSYIIRDVGLPEQTRKNNTVTMYRIRFEGNDVYRFNIEPNKINYIGDFDVKYSRSLQKNDSGGVTGVIRKVALDVVDNSIEAKKAIRINRPDYFSKYNFRSAIARK